MSVALYETVHIGKYAGATVAHLGNPGKPPAIAALDDVMVLDLETGRAPTDSSGKSRFVISAKPDQIEVYENFHGEADLIAETVSGRYAVVARALEV